MTVRRLQALVEEAGKPAADVAEQFDLDVADVYAALQYYHTHPEEMEEARQKERERESNARRSGGRSLAERRREGEVSNDVSDSR